MRKGFSTSKKVGAVFWIYRKWVFPWMQGVHALDYLVHERTNSLGLGWVGVYIFCVWECEVSTVWKGWKTDRNTALCWECNLAWIKSSFPGSCSICCRLPGNGIFFFRVFAGKAFAEWNQMRYFFPYRMLKCWRFWGRLAGNRRKLSFGDSRGGLPCCPSPKALADPLLDWIMTACKILSPLLSNLPRLVYSLACSDSTNHHSSQK